MCHHVFRFLTHEMPTRKNSADLHAHGHDEVGTCLPLFHAKLPFQPLPAPPILTVCIILCSETSLAIDAKISHNCTPSSHLCHTSLLFFALKPGLLPWQPISRWVPACKKRCLLQTTGTYTSYSQDGFSLTKALRLFLYILLQHMHCKSL